MSSSNPDPCSNYETNGVVDVDKLFTDTVALATCLEAELNKLTSVFGQWIAHDVRGALFAIKNAHLVHRDASKHDTPLE